MGARIAARLRDQFLIFRFVRHERVLDYLMCGWHIAQVDLGHHSEWAVLMQWLCECPMVEPKHGTR